MAAKAETRAGRISMRVDPTVDEALRSAAEIEHKTLTSFVLDAAWSHARIVLRDRHRLTVDAEEFARILDELDQPAKVISPLLEAAQRVAQEEPSQADRSVVHA